MLLHVQHTLDIPLFIAPIEARDSMLRSRSLLAQRIFHQLEIAHATMNGMAMMNRILGIYSRVANHDLSGVA